MEYIWSEDWEEQKRVRRLGVGTQTGRKIGGNTDELGLGDWRENGSGKRLTETRWAKV